MKSIVMIPNNFPTILEQGIDKPTKCQCGNSDLSYKEEPSHTQGLVIPYFQCNACRNKHVKIWWLEGPEKRAPRRNTKERIT